MEQEWKKHPVERVNHHIISMPRRTEACITDHCGNIFNFQAETYMQVLMRSYADPAQTTNVSQIRELLGIRRRLPPTKIKPARGFIIANGKPGNKDGASRSKSLLPCRRDPNTVQLYRYASHPRLEVRITNIIVERPPPESSAINFEPVLCV